MRLHLRTHLVILALAVLLPVLVLSAFAVATEWGRGRQAAEHGLETTARALAVAIDRDVQRTITALAVLATSEELTRGDLRRFYRDLELAREAHGGWDNLLLADTGGRQLLNLRVPFGTALPHIVNMAMIDDIVTNKRPYVSGVSIVPVAGRPMVSIGVPVLRHGSTRYVLIAGVVPEKLGWAFSDQQLPDAWLGTLVDKTNKVIARTKDVERYVGKPASERLLAATSAVREGTFQGRTLDGVPVFTSFSRSTFTGWVVVIGVPSSLITASAWRSFGPLSIGAAIATAVAVSLALLWTARFTRPITTLTRAAEALGRGQAPQHIVSSVVEIDDAAAALHSAAQARDQREAEVQAKAERLRTFAEITRAITSSTDLDSTLAAIATAAARLMNAPAASFWLADDDRQLLHLRASSHDQIAAEFPQRTVAYHEGILGAVATQRAPCLVPDVREDSRTLAREWSVAHGFVGMYAAPILWQDSLLAVISLNARQPLTLSAEDRELLETFIGQAAVTIRNAQLLDLERTARETAEVANESKDHFLATLSHELRTPLTSVLGWARLLQGRSLPPERVQQGLTAIERNAVLQSQLIHDLLDVSRIISGKMTIDYVSVDFVETMRDSVEALRSQAEAKGVVLTFSAEPGTPRVLGDAVRLQQIAANCIGNAIKFTPPAGRIDVRVDTQNKMARLVVSDTGIGIKAEVLPEIFERFRQGDSSTTRHHSGLGLGLAIAKHLTDIHGGTITATSAGTGHGTTFTVQIPLVTAQEAEPPGRAPTIQPPAIEVSLKGLAILLVDDDTDTREMVSVVLENRKASVTPAESAATALRLMDHRRFDVLVSDIGMPNTDGYALLRLLRENGNSIPAVALTAFAGSDDRERAIAAGFARHVPKPVDPDLLVTAVIEASQRP